MHRGQALGPFYPWAITPWHTLVSPYHPSTIATLLMNEKCSLFCLLHRNGGIVCGEGRLFTIRTDHKSLKFLLEQKLNMPLQHARLVNLVGCDFNIQYKRGVDNTIANTLSWLLDDKGKTPHNLHHFHRFIPTDPRRLV